MRVSEEQRYNDDQRHPIPQCVRLALVEVQLPMPIVLGEGLDLTLLPLVHDDDQASFGLLLSLALATGADLGERLSALPNRYGLVATDEAARTSEHDHERRGRGGEGPWYTMERRGELGLGGAGERRGSIPWRGELGLGRANEEDRYAPACTSFPSRSFRTVDAGTNGAIVRRGGGAMRVVES